MAARAFSLNPLKSGPTFGFSLRLWDFNCDAGVSIPSNRVLPSVIGPQVASPMSS